MYLLPLDLPDVMWQNKMFYLQFHKTNRHQICHSGDFYWGAPTNQVTYSFDHRSRHATWQNHNVISPLICIKLGKVVNSVEKLLLTKSHDSLILWSSDATWQNKKSFISTSVKPINIRLGTMVTKGEGLPPTRLHNPEQLGHIMSRDKLEMFHLSFHKTYKHKTW